MESKGTDLGDGYGPFVPTQFRTDSEVLEILTEGMTTDYGDDVAAKAKKEYQDIRNGSKAEIEINNKIKELKNRISKAYTKSKNPKVREKFKDIRDKLNKEVEVLEEELRTLKL